MKYLFLVIILLCNTKVEAHEAIDPYCKKNLKGSYSKKKKKNICWCVDDNLKQLTSEERTYLMARSLPKKKNDDARIEDTLNEFDKKRIEKKEYEIFKNCSVNYKWKANHDDIGVPDDISAH